MSKFTSDVTQFGANYLYSASGLQRAVGQIQAGELYIHSVGETKATGFFDPQWDGDGRVAAPHIMVTPVVDPSGHWWISASGVTDFTVTFNATPLGDNFAATPYLVATWATSL